MAGPGEKSKASFPDSPKHLSPADSMKAIEKDKDFVDISTFPGLFIDLRYASVNNFMGINMYGPIYGSGRKVFLHKDAADKLTKAFKLLKKEKPGWSFLVFDAMRPRSVQCMMCDNSKHTPHPNYVPNPPI